MPMGGWIAPDWPVGARRRGFPGELSIRGRVLQAHLRPRKRFLEAPGADRSEAGKARRSAPAEGGRQKPAHIAEAAPASGPRFRPLRRQGPCLSAAADAHHLRFAQKPGRGRKVSDEFTVPLAGGHHREVLRCGDEADWWRRLAVEPTALDQALWLETHPFARLKTEPGTNKLCPSTSGRTRGCFFVGPTEGTAGSTNCAHRDLRPLRAFYSRGHRSGRSRAGGVHQNRPPIASN